MTNDLCKTVSTLSSSSLIGGRIKLNAIVMQCFNLLGRGHAASNGHQETDGEMTARQQAALLYVIQQIHR